MLNRDLRPDAFDLDDLVVRYAALRPCTTAFIDARTPGSDRKENFTIIGPGVAENPDQYVHITRPHGFNIGGARQPPGCVNSQHFHETAEVFFVHSGRWAFRAGEFANEGEVILNPGDVISIPTHVFRGFENVGDETGFLYAVLGGDDPGRVIWAPDVLKRAEGNGLALTESGRLIDALKGERLEPGEVLVTPLARDILEKTVQHADSDLLETFVIRASHPPAAPVSVGVGEALLIGLSTASPPAPLSWPHGFTAYRLEFDTGAQRTVHRRAETEVWFVHVGRLRVEMQGLDVILDPGDVFTPPPGAARTLTAIGEGPATAFVVRRGDWPAAALGPTG